LSGLKDGEKVMIGLTNIRFSPPLIQEKGLEVLDSKHFYIHTLDG
jgi:hypothetical protein